MNFAGTKTEPVDLSTDSDSTSEAVHQHPSSETFENATLERPEAQGICQIYYDPL